ncbi:type II toxin-antitoxin system Phd/YefM family antitoxin [Candidatus Poriferisodalis sp.]|uniref:type II toxin-antitoxin system Phd/YefM family antitoxin n=1 Tax=Candidatus Poriferisodalis sp. TaxID=3101277 RepID=UPI003B02775A
MADITATEASRGLAGVLDAVEHHGVCFTVIRRGKALARIESIRQGEGLRVKQLLGRAQPDPDWLPQLTTVRGLLEIDAR